MAGKQRWGVERRGILGQDSECSTTCTLLALSWGLSATSLASQPHVLARPVARHDASSGDRTDVANMQGFAPSTDPEVKLVVQQLRAWCT